MIQSPSRELVCTDAESLAVENIKAPVTRGPDGLLFELPFAIR